MTKRRVVVTGVGMITPLGVNSDETWQGLLAGKPGIRRITQFDASAFPTQIAGEVVGFNPEDYIENFGGQGFHVAFFDLMGATGNKFFRLRNPLPAGAGR